MNSLNRIVALSLVAGLASPAWAGELLDTRLSFVFADDNVFAGPGETNPNSPDMGFGAGPQNNQFFDNYNTRYSGFESLSNLVLHAKSPAFFEGFVTEAALAILLAEIRSGELRLRDNSSYVRLAWRPQSWSEKENIEFVGFPVSADRFRLGYLYRLSWGGNSIYGSRATRNGIPGAKLQINQDRWYAYVGGKTALFLDDTILEEQTAYGALAGAGFDILPILRVEAGAGYFQKGKIPSLANQGIDAPVNALGASGRISLHVNEPVSESMDLKLYKNDPDVFEKLFSPSKYQGGISYTVSLEASRMYQTLADPDVFARTEPQAADALALQGRVTVNFARFSALAVYRSLEFIQFDVPGFPPYHNFPDGTEVKPEMFLAVGADYHFPKLRLTPGIVVGVQQAASMTPPDTLMGGNEPIVGMEGQRTVVFRDTNLVSILPPNTEPLLIWSAKSSTRWDISEMFAAVGEVYWTHDPNRATFIQDVTGVVQQVFEDNDRLGFNLIVQARF
ncbi:MAG: hypothetical protein WBV82_26295 [Myxococcaceae bacterium]